MIQYWGYPFENHVVTTRDGYILNLHRIPHGANEKSEYAKSVQRPVVFLGHALECSSSEYAFGPANKSLAYILADAGTEFEKIQKISSLDILRDLYGFKLT